jgi:hypothetical protein
VTRLAAALLASALAACGSECQDLARDYASALRLAQRCDPARPDACVRPVMGALDEARCPSFVDADEGAALDDLAHAYASARCKQSVRLPCVQVEGQCRSDVDGGPRCVP